MPPLIRVLAAAITVAAAGALPVFLTSALVVQLNESFRFGTLELGLAVGVYFTAGALTSARMGRVAEGLGAARALRVTAALSAACAGILSIIQGFWGLAAVLAVAGVVNALGQPAANLYLVRAVAASRRGLAFAVKQSAMPAATLLGGLAVPLIALQVGWRWAYGGAALWALASILLVPCKITPAHAEPVPGGQERAPRRAMLLLSLAIGLGAASACSLASFTVAGAVQAGVADGAAGLLLALGGVTAIGTRLVAGIGADRRAGGHLRVVARMLLAGSLGFAILALDRPVAFVAAVPLAFGAGWGWPGLFNLAVVTHNTAAPGAATGVTQTGTYVGAVLGPVIFGFVASAFSWPAAWLLASLWSVLGGLAALAARADLRAARAHSSTPP